MLLVCPDSDFGHLKALFPVNRLCDYSHLEIPERTVSMHEAHCWYKPARVSADSRARTAL